jgi:aminoglycoside phosphotransferase (APT) family kinase protein
MQALGVLGPPLRGLGEPIVARATRSSWSQAPTWVHGDVAPANLLVTDGRLSGVIDFGCSAVGDPACDLVAAWTVVDAATRPRFARAAGLDRDTWDRARGWAVWKAAITLVDPDGSPAMQALARRTFTALGAG